MPEPDTESGLSVFIVEDEALVAMNLEDMLTELGCQISGSAMRVDAALGMIDAEFSADVAVLDVNLAGKPVFPVAEKLSARGVPIIFATGYGQSGLPESWHGRPVLQKPYTLEEVSRSLRQAVARRERAPSSGDGL
jgi:DNA-binding NtrC family response regulator